MITLTSLIGWAFIGCILIGSFWPGMNFHVYLLSDESILEVYKQKVVTMEMRIAAKEKK